MYSVWLPDETCLTFHNVDFTVPMSELNNRYLFDNDDEFSSVRNDRLRVNDAGSKNFSCYTALHPRHDPSRKRAKGFHDRPYSMIPHRSWHFSLKKEQKRSLVNMIITCLTRQDDFKIYPFYTYSSHNFGILKIFKNIFILML